MIQKIITCLCIIFCFINSNLIKAQNITDSQQIRDPLFYDVRGIERIVRGKKIGWFFLAAKSNIPYPAISVYGENGGTAFYKGYDKKGSYILLNGKVFLWDDENLTEVKELPKILLNKKEDNVDIKFDPTKNFYGFDPFFPFPNGKYGRLSWAYPAGTTAAVFAEVWIEGDGRAVYHGTDFMNSYITDTITGQLLKWDGTNLTPVSTLPKKLMFSRDDFITKTERYASNLSDPFLPWLINENDELAWYYPRDPNEPDNMGAIQQYPIVWLYGKDSGLAVYIGYDTWGSYFTMNKKNFLWDGENVTQIDKIPTGLYNTGASATPVFLKPPQLFNQANVNQPGDPFMPGYNNSDLNSSSNNGEITWDYIGGEVLQVYSTPESIGAAQSLSMAELTYHGYNENGSYLSIDSLKCLWNGIELIPIDKIPEHLYNKPSK